MRLHRRAALSGGAALLLYAACGFPDFQYQSSDGGSSSTSTSGGGGGQPPTGGGGQGGTGTGGTSSGQAGQGGSGGCALGDIGACGQGSKCTIVDTATGQIGCGMAGPKQPWQKCNGDADCVDGSWCDLELLACKPFCSNAGDCVFNNGNFTGECVPAKRGNGSPIGGSAKHCLSGCDPRSGAPCDTTGSVTCIYVGSGNFDCAVSQNTVEGFACNSDPACAPGLVCVGPPNDAYCRRWCSPPELFSSDCSLASCNSLNPQIFYEGAEYGVCG